MALLRRAHRATAGSMTFPAVVSDPGVVDGDTVHFTVQLLKLSRRFKDASLGFGLRVEAGYLTLRYSFRFYGCNAAEHGTPGGDAATANLEMILPPGKAVTLSSVKNDKFSRYDASIEVDGYDLVSKLLAEQWVAAWNGEGEKPTPPWPRTVT